MNIYDISKEAGVSIATVSRVLNGSASVRPKTREKVFAVIERHGYTPNAFARGLGLNTMKTIGIMCADASDIYLAQAIFYIERDLRKNGYDSILCCTGYELEQKQNRMKMLLGKRVDAIILIGSNYVEEDSSHNDYIRETAAQVPVMIVNGALDGANIYSTLCDDYSAMHELTRLLVQSGHNNLLYLHNSTSFSARRKLMGFRNALESKGIAVDEERICLFDSKGQGINDIRDYLLSLDCTDGIDGIVCADDRLAVGAMKFATAKGLKVPEQLAVTGFNNSDLAMCCTPELTSVDNRLETLCSHCIKTLMDVLGGSETPTQTVFSFEIVQRGTTSF